MSDKRDCYFFSEEHDMGARIQTCLYSDVVFGKCECPGCTNFLSKTEADKIVRAAINKPSVLLNAEETQ